MSCDLAIRIKNISKCYQIYDTPRDRLKQFIVPKIKRALGLKTKQYYHEFWALRDISFEVKRGETVGIIGRNGSGKSTLLQIICGTLTPSSGTVETFGRVAALLELGSGFNPEFTGRENIYMNASILGLTAKEIDTKYDDIVSFADIGDYIEQPVKTYSSGMYVRLAFAVMAHADADILIVDEALSVGDAFFTQKCMRFLRKFMKTGTVLFVSHDTSSIKSLCNHAKWIEKGQVLCAGAPKEVCELYLEAFYEVQQGKSSTTRLRPTLEQNEFLTVKDQRLDFINRSNLRNDIKLFDFDPNADSFGKGGAEICSVRLLDTNGNMLAWLVGGEKVTLRINAKAYQHLYSPIIGFFVKDRLGQTLFGDNTYLSNLDNSIACMPGKEIQADFVFCMPILPAGDYSITAAIADGTQDEHIQHHWIHDAVTFRSESSSVATGLIGIPMFRIKLEIME